MGHDHNGIREEILCEVDYPWGGETRIAAFANELKRELRESWLENYFKSLPRLYDKWGYGINELIGFELNPGSPN